MKVLIIIMKVLIIIMKVLIVLIVLIIINGVDVAAVNCDKVANPRAGGGKK